MGYLNGLITGGFIGLILGGRIKPQSQSSNQSNHLMENVATRQPRQLRARVRRVANKVTEGVRDILRKNK
jgi:hypothetical protein